MSDLNSQITALEDQLENLRRKKMIEDEAAKLLTPDQKLAIELHNFMCTWNHTDGCGWHYEIRGNVHSWDRGSAHDNWLGKARKISAFCDEHHTPIDAAIKVLKFASQLR